MTEGNTPSNDVAIQTELWYFGKLKRTEAEQVLLLAVNENGAYLIRDSESRRNEFALSVRYGDAVIHYRIRRLDEGAGFYIAQPTTFRSLQELVEHYSRDADRLCVNLRKVCVQVLSSFVSTSERFAYRY